MERICCWLQSESFDPLCLLLLFLVELAVCQLDLFVLKSLFCLVLSLMEVFVVSLLLLPDKFSITLIWVRMFHLKVIFSYLSFFIFSSSDLILFFRESSSSERFHESSEFTLTSFIMFNPLSASVTLV